MDVLDAIHSRRSIRSYQDRAVERPLIEQVIHDAASAPPPFRDQVPWTFHVIEGAAWIEELGQRAMDHARRNRPEGPGWSWIEREGFRVFWGAPVVIVTSGPVEDCCRAGQNLMLSAHGRGLGTCWVGSPMLWLRSVEAKSELGIPQRLTPVSAICLGYANAIPPAPPRSKPEIVWCSDAA